MYDKIEELESLLIAARAKKQAIEAEKLTGDNIYKVLIYFCLLYTSQCFQPVRQTPAGIHPLQGGCGAGRCAGI